MAKNKKGKKPKALNLAGLGQLARRAVIEAQKTGGTGEEKGKAARRQVAQWVDEALQFGDGPIGQAAEAVDGPVALLLASLVQGAYEDIKRAGGL